MSGGRGYRQEYLWRATGSKRGPRRRSGCAACFLSQLAASWRATQSKDECGLPVGSGIGSRDGPLNWQGWINAPAAGKKKTKQLYPIQTSPHFSFFFHPSNGAKIKTWLTKVEQNKHSDIRTNDFSSSGRAGVALSEPGRPLRASKLLGEKKERKKYSCSQQF